MAKETMSWVEAQERIDKLTEDLHRHNYLYYVKSQPAISDFQFDKMLEELQDLEKQFPDLAHANSPTKRVGGDITKNFPTVEHQWPMLSLSNSYSKEEVDEWEERIQKLTNKKLEYVCELKYDGVAIGVTYKNGELYQAVTRGDGFKGEDITPNVRTVGSIPLKLRGSGHPNEFEIRGEIYMPLSTFRKLNEEREAKGETTYANPRNITSGTLKLQDSSVVAKRDLDCFLYAFYAHENPFTEHYESLEKVREWGFKAPAPEDGLIRKCSTMEEVMAFIDEWETKREDLDFEVDGVVIKVNDYRAHKDLGYTAKSPRWALAYKFQTEQAETKLNKIDYQVGRTGKVTPVAHLEPVHIAGTTVKRATLHNSDYILELDIRENDQVYVEKGGEIIPKVVGVDKEQRPEGTQPTRFISNCPECETELIRREGEADYVCPNHYGCPPQVKGRIEHFISRNAMDIDGLGPETIELLFQQELIKDVADLYELKKEDLLPLERVADKSASNLLESIQASKEQPFEKVLYAIGIRFVGETVAKKLAKAFGSMDALMNASEKAMVEVDDIGARIASSVREFFQEARNLELINRLRGYGLNLEISEKEQEGRTDLLQGASIVVSGVFSRYSRDELKALIEQHGGKVTSSVTGNTTYLVAGDNMGPIKRQKAEKLGVRVVSEEEFLGLVGE